ARVPARTERRDAPPAQARAREHEDEQGPPEPRQERAVGEPRLGDAREEQTRVQGDHGGEVPAPGLDAAARERPARVAGRDDELGEPLERGRADERDVPREAHARAPCRVAAALRGARPSRRSSTSSVLTPGPNARRTAGTPGGASVRASVAASTWSTDADDRLPVVRRASRLVARSSSSRPSASRTASRTRGPPAW